MLEKLTPTAFEAYLGDFFELTLPDAQTMDLRLFELKRYGGRPDANRPQDMQRQESFSVVFQGSTEQPLSQGMYALSHAKMGTIDALFLVPVAQDEDGRYYEAVFN
ncbi:MAG: hypothetical protein KDE48_07740 [Anaerolineales bacterium]|nr:hypothetical protein [Anaerolineales bacterium]